MLLSIAIPTVIDAIVIVIISKGILNKPKVPKIKSAARKLGTAATIDQDRDLNRINSKINIPAKVIPKVLICESNKLCNKLLNITNIPVILKSSLFNCNFSSMSFCIFINNSFLLSSGLESIILKEILASLLSIEI